MMAYFGKSAIKEDGELVVTYISRWAQTENVACVRSDQGDVLAIVDLSQTAENTLGGNHAWADHFKTLTVAVRH